VSRRRLAIVWLAVLVVAPGADAAPVSAVISAIDATGVVTAREEPPGRTFQFTVGDVRERARLKVGGNVQADFEAKTVRLRGVPAPAYTIINIIGAPHATGGSAACYRGGCSGQVCSDQSGVITTCEYRPEYACYANARCERQADGRCGWTKTAQLQSCLQNPPQQ